LHGLPEVVLELVGNGWPRSEEELKIVLESLDVPGTPIETKVSSEGRLVEEPAQGQWRVVVIAGGAVNLPVTPPVIVLGKGADSVTLVAERLKAGKGKVEDCYGAPVQGVEVELETNQNAVVAVTNAAGEFLLPCLESTQDVAIRPDTLPFGMAVPWWQPPFEYQPTGRRPQLTCSAGEVMRVILGYSGRTVGTAVGSSGPISGETISLRARLGDRSSIAGPNYVIPTDALGRFEVATGMAEGLYEARVFRQGVRPLPVEFRVDCGGRDKLELYFAERGSECLLIEALDCAGNPIEGCHFGVWDVASLERDQLAAFAAASVTTNVAGQAEICGLAEGRHIIRRTQSVNPMPAAELVDVVDEMEVDVVSGSGHAFALWRVFVGLEARLDLTILPMNAPGAFVRFVMDGACDSPTRRLVLDETGRFTGALPSGVGHIEIVHNDSVTRTSETVLLAPGATTTVVIGD